MPGAFLFHSENIWQVAVVFAALWLRLALLVAGFVALLIATVAGCCVFTLTGGSFRSAAGLVSSCGSSLTGSLMSGRFEIGRAHV